VGFVSRLASGRVRVALQGRETSFSPAFVCLGEEEDPQCYSKRHCFGFFFKVNSVIKQRYFGQNTSFYLKERQNVNFSNQSLYLCTFFSLVLSFGFSQSSF